MKCKAMKEEPLFGRLKASNLLGVGYNHGVENLMRERILVIDNDSLMRQVIAVCLNDAGWEVFHNDYAHIDPSALKQFQANLIILNFNERDGGLGWKFVQLLKMDDETSHIPIIIMTTVFTLSAEIQAYLLTRYIHVIYQPFTLDVFIQRVQRTLMQSHQSGSLVSGDRALPILLVEDTQDLREAFEMVLMLEGYHVITAANGLLALKAVYQADHCLIFLDINMPVMNGFEFLRIYDQQPRPHSPVIILSAESDIQSHAFPSFVVDVLAKPFEIQRLLGLAKQYTQPV